MVVVERCAPPNFGARSYATERDDHVVARPTARPPDAGGRSWSEPLLCSRQVLRRDANHED